MSEEEILQMARASIQLEGPLSRIVFCKDKRGRLKRARRAVTRGGRTTRSCYPSSKGGGSVPCESSHEKAAAAVLDAAVRVAAFVAQPFKLVIGTSGERRTRIPDFFVRTITAKNYVVEVMESKELDDVLEREDLDLKAQCLREHGMTLVVWTEKLLSPDNFQKNLQSLARYTAVPCETNKHECARAYLLRHPSARLKDLMDGVFAGDELSLASLLATGAIQVDLRVHPMSEARVIGISTIKGELFNEDVFFRPWG